MKTLFLSLFFFFVLSPNAHSSVNFNEVECYRSDIATLTSVFFKNNLEQRIRKIKVKNKKTSKKLTFHYMKEIEGGKSGDWLFVFAGIGSASNSIHMKKLSSYLRSSGYKNNILLIPSIFRSDFIQSYSRNGMVGSIPEDARDLGKAIDDVIYKLTKKKMKFSKIDYLGFSLGALTAGHLASQRKEMGKNNIPEQVFLMNAPVNLLKSLSRLDKMNTLLPSFSQNVRVSTSFVLGQFTESSLDKVNDVFCSLSSIEGELLEGFIANNLVRMVGNVFYSAQRRNSTGYFEDRLGKLSPFASREEEREYWRKAKLLAQKLDFEDYVKYGLMPIVGVSQRGDNESSPINQLNMRVSMTALRPIFSKYENDFFLIHSTDDFLLSSQSEFAGYSHSFLKSNSFIVERGGHLGLLQNTPAIEFIVGKTL